eukprot:5388039-Alexandrium_andersonii.AAC.1
MRHASHDPLPEDLQHPAPLQPQAPGYQEGPRLQLRPAARPGAQRRAMQQHPHSHSSAPQVRACTTRQAWE